MDDLSGIGAVNREGTGGNLKRELSMESSLVEALSHSVMWNQFLSACFLRQCARNLRLRLLVCTNLYFDNFLSGANHFLYLLHIFFWPQRPSCTRLLGTFCISIDVTARGITFYWWGFSLFDKNFKMYNHGWIWMRLNYFWYIWTNMDNI